jgi:hypothetical protein
MIGEKIVSTVSKTAMTQAQNKFFSKLYDDIFGYWRIYDFLNLHCKIFSKGSTTIESEEVFWSSILKKNYKGNKCVPKKLNNGDVVTLKDFFMSEWAPKLPGQAWTVKSSKDISESLKHIDKKVELGNKMYEVIDPYGKNKIVSAGYGSIRTNPGIGNNDFYAYFSLVTEKNWYCDLGIPIVVSKQVYQKCQDFLSEGTSAWVREMKGIFIADLTLPIDNIIPHALGARYTNEQHDILTRALGLPKCFIYISSPMDINLGYHNTHPECTAWTMFETELAHEPIRYTYACFNPKVKDSIEEAVAFINYYVNEYDGKKIITDFDGKIQRLNSSTNLTTNLIQSNNGIQELFVTVETVDRWREQLFRPF